MIGDKPLELHAHCTIGLGEHTYMEAPGYGVQALQCASGAAADGTSNPPSERVVSNLRELGHTIRIDDQALAEVVRVLRLKERLGLFDDPYARGMRAESAETVTARRRLARDVATKSLVLAKNSAGVLPLRQDVRRVCVIGPLADAWREMRGPWAAAGYDEPSITVLAGLRNSLPGADVVHADGVTIAATEPRDAFTTSTGIAACSSMPMRLAPKAITAIATARFKEYMGLFMGRSKGRAASYRQIPAHGATLVSPPRRAYWRTSFALGQR